METAKSFISNLFGSTSHLSKCEVCGNEYYKCLEIRINGEAHIFDSFECAIHALAPHCVHCGCQIIGHGVEAEGLFYCSAHCSRENGIHILKEHDIQERSLA